MKNRNTLMILASLALPAMGFAADKVVPVYEITMYGIKISADGQWIGSQAGTAGVYSTDNNKITYYEDCELGIGNIFSSQGHAVGSGTEGACIMFDGKVINLPEFRDFWFSTFNAITKDAKRAVGVTNNKVKSETGYVPFVVDLDANLNITKFTPLPYPKLDFFRAAPQFISACWISDDGKTIVGQVTDWRGFYDYPIVFLEDASGNWSYKLPSEELFNPTHIEIPDNPWLNEPEYPYPENFMSGNRLTAYQVAYQAYQNGTGPEPDVTKYMTEEEYVEYELAVNEYNDWFYGQEARMKQYVKIYDEILGTTPVFALNELALHPSGEYFMQHGGVIDDNNVMVGKIYTFTPDGLENIIEPPKPNVFPTQILPDGTVVATLPHRDVPSSYFLLPGETEFITVEEYLEPNYPYLAEYIETNFPNGSGMVCVSDDMSVMSGALIPDQLVNGGADVDYVYSTYIFTGLQAYSGVESIAIPEKAEVYRVYNLSGVKVLETKTASDINTLPRGIYVVNGKKYLVK